ncbi:MAG: hypothetical protein EA001_14900 [Oscillatoriales cyanobacterium]|nr:MAG: hypothetical protein EA001_14900 [Oscillatoriales cyanobacterium]
MTRNLSQTPDQLPWTAFFGRVGAVAGAIALPIVLLLGQPAVAWAESGRSPSLPPRPPVRLERSAEISGDHWRDLLGSQVIYLGEIHDRFADVPIKLEVIHRVFQQVENFSPSGPHGQRMMGQRTIGQQTTGRLTIALEMFQQPAQALLDDYIAGRIDEATLRDRTEYADRWGYDWEIIAPILRWARANGVAVRALNVPAEVTRQIARGGWEQLDTEAARWLPPIAEMQLGPPTYRAWLREIYDTIHQQHGASAQNSTQNPTDQEARFGGFFAAQVSWDETMAAGVARSLQGPGDRVVVILGRGHMVYGWGVPDRVARRKPGVVQRSILLGPLDELAPIRDGRAISDYWWSESRGF